MGRRIVIISIATLYAISILPYLCLPDSQQSDLKTAIQLVQKLSKSSGSEQTEFESAFYESVKALRLTAGIQVIIVDTPQARPPHNSSILIVDAKPPHLISGFLIKHFIIQPPENHFYYGDEYKSLPTPPPTPPPLIS